MFPEELIQRSKGNFKRRKYNQQQLDALLRDKLNGIIESGLALKAIAQNIGISENYKQSIADKTSEIEKLQRQISAMQNDTSASAIAKRKQLAEENKAFEDTQYQHGIETWKNKQITYGVSSNTISKYEYDYRRFFQGTVFEKMDIRNITEEDITAFMVSRIKKLDLKEKAGKALWGYLSGVFRSARINKKILDDPCQYVDTKSFFKLYNRNMKSGESRILNDAEIKKLMKQVMEDHDKNPGYNINKNL